MFFQTSSTTCYATTQLSDLHGKRARNDDTRNTRPDILSAGRMSFADGCRHVIDHQIAFWPSIASSRNHSENVADSGLAALAAVQLEFYY
jgi:hypothetical protein